MVSIGSWIPPFNSPCLLLKIALLVRTSQSIFFFGHHKYNQEGYREEDLTRVSVVEIYALVCMYTCIFSRPSYHDHDFCSLLLVLNS